MTNIIIYCASDILPSILSNLLLANITILLWFLFLLLVAFNIFFTSSVAHENVRPRLALAIPTGVPITVANDVIEMLPFVADNAIKDL